MSSNPLINTTNSQAVKELVLYIIQLLNIKVDTELVIADIEQDLSTVKDLNLFRNYIKQNLKNSKFEYLTGFQKFIEMFNVYTKLERNELTEKNCEQIDSFSEELYKRTTAVFDEVDYQMQVKGLSIEQFTSYADNFTSKQLEVLGEVGSVKKIWHLCKYGRNTLRDSILKIVHKKTIMKINTSNQIAHTSNLSLEDLRSKANAK